MSSIWIESNLWARASTWRRKTRMIVKQTETRDKECKPACHHFPAEVSSSSSFPPGYISKVQITRKKEGINYKGDIRSPHRGDRLHVAMSQPDSQSVIFLGIKTWSSCFHQKRIRAYLGHLVVHKKDELLVHMDYHLLIDSSAVDQVRLRSSLRHTNYWSGRMLK